MNATLRCWKEHIKETLKPLLENYSTALETGDLEFAAYSLGFYCQYSYFIGSELIELEREIANYSYALSQIKQKRTFNWNAIYWQCVSNLVGVNENPHILTGKVYEEEKLKLLNFEANDGVGLLNFYINKLHLCYLFQEFAQAVENSAQAEKYLDNGIGSLLIPQFHFYDSLAQLALYLNVEESQQQQILDKVKANQEKIQIWAHYAPMNFLHKHYLVEAEQHRVKGEYLEAMDNYDRAIDLARENEYINEEALANELAARFYLECGKRKIAQIYLTDAYYCYLRWGAKAKVEDLAKCYPQLLAPILQSDY